MHTDTNRQFLHIHIVRMRYPLGGRIIIVTRLHTVLSRFLTHAPLLEYRHTEVNHNIYNIDAPAFSLILKTLFFVAISVCAKKHDYTV